MLPGAAQGAADLNGLRPHAAGPKTSEEMGVNREKSQGVAGNSGLLGRSWALTVWLKIDQECTVRALHNSVFVSFLQLIQALSYLVRMSRHRRTRRHHYRRQIDRQTDRHRNRDSD